MKRPPTLVPGDLIFITAPAKAIEIEYIEHAISLFKDQGFRVEVGNYCVGKFGYFSGTDNERTQDLQQAIDKEEVKAIFCARGGYGSIRILDSINWAAIVRNPKWLIGYSDIGIFHHRLLKLGIQSIHGTMPLNFKKNSPEALQSVFDAVKGKKLSTTYPSNTANRKGEAKGILVGGNLSVIYSLLATKDCFDFRNTVLFIEDLSEQLYHLDRMIFTLKKAGVFDLINGLIVGGMTDMKDTSDTIGLSVNEIILQHLKYVKIPVAFDFPCGHIFDNRAMIIGAEVIFSVSDKTVNLSYQ